MLDKAKGKRPEAITITIGKTTTQPWVHTKSKVNSGTIRHVMSVDFVLFYVRGLKYFNDYNLSQKENIDDLNKFNEIKLSLLMNVALSNYKVSFLFGF